MNNIIIMKYSLTLLVTILLACFNADAQYFQARVERSGQNLVFKIRAKPGGGNLAAKWDRFEFFLRKPTADPVPSFSAPIPNTTDFPGLTMSYQGIDVWGNQPGYVNYYWKSPDINACSSQVTYTDGVEYTVFTVPFTGGEAPLAVINFQAVGNNFTADPYYLTLSRAEFPADMSSQPVSCGSVGCASQPLFYGTGVSSTSAAGGGLDFFQTVPFAVVPVKFTGFNVTKKDDNADIVWSVQNETTVTDKYEIERSINGIDFAKVYTVTPKNNGLTSNSYALSDLNLSAIKQTGLIFYRIKQTDKDGKYVYTEIKSVRIDNKFGISIFPNPVRDITSVAIELETASDISIIIINPAGKEMQRSEMKGVKGLNTHKLNMNNMAAGSYQVKVMIGTEIKLLPVVKTN